jgi:hypothetical protein
MTDEIRILRTIGIPVVVAIVLLVAVPKMCVKAVLVSKARKEKASGESGLQSGLRIESAHKPASYPSGLDADRVRYLIEIDSRFSTPYTARVNKSQISVADASLIAALQKLGYVELAPDGSRTITRDGLLHIDGLSDDGSSWTFPIATRHFESVSAIDGDSANALVTIIWKWQPNAVGAVLLPGPKRHEASATFAPGTSGWTLTGLTVDNDLQ